jgi:DNA-damage-inducible protein D
MEEEYEGYRTKLEGRRRLTETGKEYWMARELMGLLSYTDWRNFRAVIDKAIVACKGAGVNPERHFVDTDEMVTIGSGAQREREDCYLTRYACYLIAMNADSGKPEVAFAMTYFAEQTRRQELRDQLPETEQRLHLRMRLMENNRRLAGAAKKAGVVRHPLFQDAGYRGLYQMGLGDVKAHKNIPPSQDLLDNVGRLELSALDFKATLTEHRLNRDEVKTEQRAIETHRAVGQEVRTVMMREKGVRPEDLPAEPSIRQLVQKTRRQIKDDETA